MLIIICVLSVLEVSAQKIHWLLFIDTKDTAVGQMDINGREFLKNEFVDPINAVLFDAGMDTKVYDCYDNNCSPEKLNSVVNSLNVSTNDIIFFYYIGHGGRSVIEDDSHPWPQMCLGQFDEKKFVDLESLHNKLKAKRPRLCITVGMCCNSYANIPRRRNTIVPNAVDYSGDSFRYYEEEKQLIVDLFTKQCGSLIATSASPGETSKGVQFDGLKPMDVYTTCLVASFDELITGENSGDVTLEKLFKKTGTLVSSIEIVDKRGNRSPQNPHFSASLNNGGCGIINPEPDPISNVTVANDLETVQNMLDATLRNQNVPSINGFAPNAVVRVLARDGRTQLDRMSVEKYLSRISSSGELIMRVIPVRTIMSGGKIAELHVREILVDRRY